MSETKEARDALLFMISLEVKNGHLAPALATVARNAVDTLYRAAQQQRPADLEDGE